MLGGGEGQSGKLGGALLLQGLVVRWCTSPGPLAKLSSPRAHFLPLMTRVEKGGRTEAEGSPLGEPSRLWSVGSIAGCPGRVCGGSGDRSRGKVQLGGRVCPVGKAAPMPWVVPAIAAGVQGKGAL